VTGRFDGGGIVLRVLAAAAAVLLLCAGRAEAAPASTAPADLSCKGRAIATAGKPAEIDPTALLDSAMKRKPFVYGEAASVAGTEAMLVQFYGMRQSLRSLPAEQDRKSVARISHLMQNDYVIAGQMALGAELMGGRIPPGILGPLARYVTNSTEPYHGDDELTSVNDQIKRATVMLGPMSEKPRAFARWAMRAAGFDDAVALDAAMAGLCLSSPSSNDMKLLGQAYQVAKLDRSKAYRDPSIHSGAEPSLNPLRSER
jgi:hypothetical protein